MSTKPQKPYSPGFKLLKISNFFADLLAYVRAQAHVYARVLALALFSFAISSTLLSLAQADFNPADDSALLEVRIRPSVDRGVMIDTESVNLNLGVVELGVSTQTVSPATVTILGNVTNIELTLEAQIIGGWTFDNNVTESSETNKLALWALFTDTDTALAPTKTGSKFDNTNDALESDSTVFGPARAGADGNPGFNDRFEDGVTDMDSLVPGRKRHLWFYLNTPSQTSTSDEQQIQINLSAVQGQ